MKVTQKADGDETTIAEYSYDAQGRRIKSVLAARGELDGTVYAYYNDRWQMLESRDGSENVVTQTVYGTQYVDEIVRWWRDGRGAMYVLQDANWNVISTVDYDGKVLDRVRLTPYGIATFDTETINGDYDGDGDTDSSDNTELTNCYGTATGACRIFDYDDNGTINVLDTLDFAALSPTDSDVQRQPARRTSPNRFPFAHQGLVLDQETLGYQNRHRQYAPQQRRFMQRDPLCRILDLPPASEYDESPSLYTYAASAPASNVDPSGLACGPGGWGDWIVPDRPYGHDFTGPCQFHDDCYGACWGGQHVFSKGYCDTTFLARMRSECLHLYAFWEIFDRRHCLYVARVYYTAVDWLGQGAYNRACPSKYPEPCDPIGDWPKVRRKRR